MAARSSPGSSPGSSLESSPGSSLESSPDSSPGSSLESSPGNALAAHEDEVVLDYPLYRLGSHAPTDNEARMMKQAGKQRAAHVRVIDIEPETEEDEIRRLLWHLKRRPQDLQRYCVGKNLHGDDAHDLGRTADGARVNRVRRLREIPAVTTREYVLKELVPGATAVHEFMVQGDVAAYTREHPDAGFRVPRPVAYASTRVGSATGDRRHSFVMEYVPCMEGVQPMLNMVYEDECELHRKLMSVALRVHAAGFFHGDFHCENVCLRGEEAWVVDFGRGGRVSDPEWEEFTIREFYPESPATPENIRNGMLLLDFLTLALTNVADSSMLPGQRRSKKQRDNIREVVANEKALERSPLRELFPSEPDESLEELVTQTRAFLEGRDAKPPRLPASLSSKTRDAYAMMVVLHDYTVRLQELRDRETFDKEVLLAYGIDIDASSPLLPAAPGTIAEKDGEFYVMEEKWQRMRVPRHPPTAPTFTTPPRDPKDRSPDVASTLPF